MSSHRMCGIFVYLCIRMEMDIDNIFANHYGYYGSLGVETVKQQSAQYRQVEDAYQGRVVYELLQNAIDKAESKIRIELLCRDDGNYLIVANDGKAFTYGSNYDYRHGNTQRYDFQSLCSIATSTKSAMKDIGNKGVGFKSVFSLNDYVAIYTRGMIYPGAFSADVDFVIYNLFQTPESLSFVGADISRLLASVRAENVNWGIPGYYFPKRIDRRPEFIGDYFDKGFVTVVCVPVAPDKLDIVRNKISVLTNYQFYFIPTKASFKDKHILLETGGTGLTFHKVDIKQSDRVVSRRVSQKTVGLGRAAGIDVDPQAMVSVYFRPADSGSAQGSLYNYLPTEMMSLFKSIDINADFHTSVDRRHIVLEGDEPVGRYNRALLVECLQLAKDALEDSDILPESLFDWRYAEFAKTDIYADVIREVFLADFPSYACRVFCKRMKGNDRNNYDIFYQRFLFAGLDRCHSYNYSWFKDKVILTAEIMKKAGVRFLPDTPCASDNIFYRSESVDLSMPSSIPVEFTSYSVNHWRWDDFCTAAEIKKFENTSEVYSLYWQCRTDGSYGACSDAMSEEEQIELLASVAMLMAVEKDGYPDCAAWRFNTIYNDTSRTDDRARGAFALSTLFYKSKDGRYRPGQLLHKSDIDEEFLASIEEKIGKENLRPLLLKTGVSLNKYTYADLRIISSLGDGLEFIPPTGFKDRLNRDELWKNVRISLASTSLHPVKVNENYNFFHRWLRNDNNKSDFNALYVGNYAAMPEYYTGILASYLGQMVADRSRRSEIRRFYNKFYAALLERDIVLIKKGSDLMTGTTAAVFSVVSEESLLGDDVSLPILLLYVSLSNANLSEKLRNRYLDVDVRLDEKTSPAMPDCGWDSVDNFLTDTDRQATALVKITQSRLTDTDYENEESRRKYYEAFRSHTVAFHETLNVYGMIENNRYEIGSIPFMICDGVIHVGFADSEAQSRNNVAKAFSTLVSGGTRFADIFELVIFSTCYVSASDREAMLPMAEEDDELSDGCPPPMSVELPEPGYADYQILEPLENGEMTVTGYSSHNVSKSDGSGNYVSPAMQKTGYDGEGVVAGYIVEEFIKEYPDTEAQRDAICAINEFLSRNDMPSVGIEDDVYTRENIRNALWYTRGGTKPFDIVTLKDGKVRLIEVKSTRGNNILRFTKRETVLAAKYKENYEIYLCDLSRRIIRPLGNILPDEPILENDFYRIEPSGFEVVLKER